MHLIIIFFIIVLDQATKLLASMNLQEGINSKAMSSFFYFTYVKNTGDSISLNFRIIAIAICILYFLYLFTLSKGALKTSICFILGGTISNLAERLLKGTVVDFLAFHTSNRLLVLNLADIILSIGVILSIYFLIVEYRKNNTYMVSK